MSAVFLDDMLNDIMDLSRLIEATYDRLQDMDFGLPGWLPQCSTRHSFVSHQYRPRQGCGPRGWSGGQPCNHWPRLDRWQKLKHQGTCREPAAETWRVFL